MKYIKFMLISILFVLVLSSTSLAKEEIISVKINGKLHKVPTVPVLVDGITLKSEVPAFIFGDRSMVPVRFISENFGAEVQWDNDTQTVMVAGASGKVLMGINKEVVLVDGIQTTLDENSIPRLVIFPNGDARTMVPLRFVSTILGYSVDWNNETRTAIINSGNNNTIDTSQSEAPLEGQEMLTEKGTGTISEITINELGEKLRIKIKTDKSIDYNAYYNSASMTHTISLSNVINELEDGAVLSLLASINNNIIRSIRLNKGKGFHDSMEIEIVLNEDRNISVAEEKDGKGLVLVLGGSEIDIVRKVEIDGNTAIAVDGAGNSNYNVMQLEDPKRIVVDIKDVTLKGKPIRTFDLEAGFINKVRISQFAPDGNYSPDDLIVRVVLDIKDGVNSPEVEIRKEHDNLLIIPKKTLWDNLEINGTVLNTSLILSLPREAEIYTSHNMERKEYNISLPKGLLDISASEHKITNSLVKSMNIYDSEDRLNIVFGFSRDVEVVQISSQVDNRVELNIKKIISNSPSDYLIMIDPGHGGTDAGATSITGKPEKDVTLNVSLRVRDRLVALGYNIVMIREDDASVELDDRPKIANDMGVDLYLSIHANSFTKSHPYGIEVHYTNDPKEKTGRENQKNFAKILLEETGKSTGNKKRYVKSTPYIVTKYTNMDAALLEMGFLSHPEDNARLESEDYREKMTAGIVTAIVRYIDEYK